MTWIRPWINAFCMQLSPWTASLAILCIVNLQVFSIIPVCSFEEMKLFVFYEKRTIRELSLLLSSFSIVLNNNEIYLKAHTLKIGSESRKRFMLWQEPKVLGQKLCWAFFSYILWQKQCSERILCEKYYFNYHRSSFYAFCVFKSFFFYKTRRILLLSSQMLFTTALLYAAMNFRLFFLLLQFGSQVKLILLGRSNNIRVP